MISKLRWVAPIRVIVVLASGIGMNSVPVSSDMIAYVYGRKIHGAVGTIPFINRLEETRSPLNRWLSISTISAHCPIERQVGMRYK